MGCCNGNNWKREEKVDHRFDYLDMREFHTNSIGCRLGHLYVWISTFRSFAIFGLDLYTAVGLLILKSYKSTVTQQTFIAHNITKWIFAGCIILSVVLLIWDWIVAIRIMRSKNISFAFTNVIVNRWYSLFSYDHHCLFYKLGSSSHRSNKVAFWVFFSFIGWKRLILSEGPRQAINALTVFSVLSTRNFALTASAYENITPFQWTVLGFMALSLLIWLFSFARFCMAAMLFLPLLCHLQGGLTEFVVRKIDKRIEQIIEKARRKRLDRYAQARREEERQPRANSTKKSGLQRNKSILTERPTLPTIPLMAGDDEKDLMQPTVRIGSDTSSIRSFDSMTKSGSAYSLNNFGAPPTRTETLPLYRPITNDSVFNVSRSQQMEPTLPNLSTSPPRLENSASTHRAAPGGPRPPMPTVPSYHRKESYGAPSGPLMASAGQGIIGAPGAASRDRMPMRPSTGTRPDPRTGMADSEYPQPVGSRMPMSQSSQSLRSTYSTQSRGARQLPF